jgi:hypothetical protein
MVVTYVYHKSSYNMYIFVYESTLINVNRHIQFQ